MWKVSSKASRFLRGRPWTFSIFPLHEMRNRRRSTWSSNWNANTFCSSAKNLLVGVWMCLKAWPHCVCRNSRNPHTTCWIWVLIARNVHSSQCGEEKGGSKFNSRLLAYDNLEGSKIPSLSRWSLRLSLTTGRDISVLRRTIAASWQTEVSSVRNVGRGLLKYNDELMNCSQL